MELICNVVVMPAVIVMIVAVAVVYPQIASINYLVFSLTPFLFLSLFHHF